MTLRSGKALDSDSDVRVNKNRRKAKRDKQLMKKSPEQLFFDYQFLQDPESQSQENVSNLNGMTGIPCDAKFFTTRPFTWLKHIINYNQKKSNTLEFNQINSGYQVVVQTSGVTYINVYESGVILVQGAFQEWVENVFPALERSLQKTKTDTNKVKGEVMAIFHNSPQLNISIHDKTDDSFVILLSQEDHLDQLQSQPIDFEEYDQILAKANSVLERMSIINSPCLVTANITNEIVSSSTPKSQAYDMAAGVVSLGNSSGVQTSQVQKRTSKSGKCPSETPAKWSKLLSDNSCSNSSNTTLNSETVVKSNELNHFVPNTQAQDNSSQLMQLSDTSIDTIPSTPPTQMSEIIHNLQRQLITVNHERDALQNKMSKLIQENSDKDHQLNTKDNQIKILTERLEQMKRQASNNCENTKQGQIINMQKVKITSLVAKAEQLEHELNTLKPQTVEFSKLNAQLQIKVSNLQCNVDSLIIERDTLHAKLLSLENLNSQVSNGQADNSSCDQLEYSAVTESENEQDMSFLTVDFTGDFSNTTVKHLAELKPDTQSMSTQTDILDKGNGSGYPRLKNVNKGSQPVYVHYTKNKNPTLSMFYPEKLHFHGKTHRSPEHAYQREKAIHQEKLWAAEIITEADSASSAKHLAAKYLAHSETWQNCKVSVMQNVLQARYKQSTQFADALHKTGDSDIVHNVACPFWGTGRNGNGQNMYGKLLMQLRKENKNREKRNPEYHQSESHDDHMISNYFIADSMGMGVELNLQGNTCSTWSTSGASLVDINSEVVRLLRTTCKSPQNIIIMAGTNDIPNVDKHDIAQQLTKTVEIVQHMSPTTNLFFCGIESRFDCPWLNDKIWEMNYFIENMCRFKGCFYIPSFAQANPHVHPACIINRGGLHFTEGGRIDLKRRIEHFTAQYFQYQTHPGEPPTPRF